MPLEAIDQLLELLLAMLATLVSRFEGRGYLLDVLDVFSDRLLLGLDVVQSPLDAVGQTAQLLLWNPLFSRPSSVGSTREPPPKPRPFADRVDGEGLPGSSSENSTYSRAVVEDHGAGGIGFRREGAFAGPTITVVVASGSSSARLSNALAPCRLSTACSIFRRPRTCAASGPWRGLSASSTAGQIAEELVVAVAMRHRGTLPPRSPSRTRPACPRSRGRPSCSETWPHALAWAIRRWTSSSVAKIRASANHTRFWVSSLTT